MNDSIKFLAGGNLGILAFGYEVDTTGVCCRDGIRYSVQRIGIDQFRAHIRH